MSDVGARGVPPWEPPARPLNARFSGSTEDHVDPGDPDRGSDGEAPAADQPLGYASFNAAITEAPVAVIGSLIFAASIVFAAHACAR